MDRSKGSEVGCVQLCISKGCNCFIAELDSCGNPDGTAGDVIPGVGPFHVIPDVGHFPKFVKIPENER